VIFEGSVKFLPAGESALSVEFGETIDPAINARVGALAESLRARPIKGVVETVPSYRALLVCFDPVLLSMPRLISGVKRRLKTLSVNADSAGAARTLTIPVCYGGAYGPDLQAVAAHTGLAAQEVVKRHSAGLYRIYMFGFLPGFPYLGGLDPALETPRLKMPRQQIPPGSVGIGGKQTGIYPLSSPGGWQLIGRTPLRPYDPQREPPVLYRAGDMIRFEPIDESQYLSYTSLWPEEGF
jgi:KipI family sensor histidine kinase inhibitor